ncbi:hypothetical protein HUA74_07035 [Myxococcus sp. CA051A]|uniref:Lipoprotein n=1 Tax=Myxococcus llanfairpwllgwyngyllgogerychwyrndrobwllllantysiliogogogochensis TaxID=2590453 RepID=A0A540WXU0_9BACT|nr:MULTISPECIES: hypothetical protein [Myxococcus]NTX02721.1 hypothetical protein [Myxococcus sp. CA040A]NTX11143.1 hypothetical protein [Myxococcus sp. CA056]NTX34765.1 hypothetical protein [Myxococcus sp. CA033]NTX60411.1 hypothetical protein [Myxococcus sp. CA051A]TQF13818.1 hypothetical protein FJV41_21990 [Myxococcus llanfairpwllgwyngyllgogerychwyrndrobwllllantysiliogogogochensis]
MSYPAMPRRSLVAVLAASLSLTACGGMPEGEPSAGEPIPEDVGTASKALVVPVATLICTRPVGGSLGCVASASGGVAPYTFYWGQQTYRYDTNKVYTSLFNPGTTLRGYGCYAPTETFPGDTSIKPKVYVVDSTGAQSSTVVHPDWVPCS